MCDNNWVLFSYNHSPRISHKASNQEEELDVIEENKPEDIQGNFEIRDLIGKIICVNYVDRTIKRLKMRRVKL